MLLLSLVLLVTSAGACRRGFTFMPEIDMNNLSLSITMPEDTSREEAVRLADEVLERVMTVDDVQDAGFMMGGGTMGGLNMGGAMGAPPAAAMTWTGLHHHAGGDVRFCGGEGDRDAVCRPAL